jgi:hypothetical protein
MVNGFIALGLNELNLHQMFFSECFDFLFQSKNCRVKNDHGYVL